MVHFFDGEDDAVMGEDEVEEEGDAAVVMPDMDGEVEEPAADGEEGE